MIDILLEILRKLLEKAIQHVVDKILGNKYSISLFNEILILGVLVGFLVFPLFFF